MLIKIILLILTCELRCHPEQELKEKEGGVLEIVLSVRGENDLLGEGMVCLGDQG